MIGVKIVMDDPNNTDPKPIWQSKMFWFNVFTFVAYVLTFLMGEDYIAENPKAVAIIGGILGVVNIALRMITEKAVTIFKKLG